MPNIPDDPQTILKYQTIPWWERYGLERLVISELTLRKFKTQDLPPMINVSTKRRQSHKIRKHDPRTYNNVATSIEAFPGDAQDTCRHPILYCVINGRADLHIADYVVHCPAGHFVLMRPGVPQPDGSRPHLEGTNSDEYCEIMHFSLLPGASSIASWICCSKAGEHWGRHSCSINQSDTVHQLSFFMRELLEKPANYQKTASNSLHNFFLLFLRELEAGHLQPSPVSDVTRTPKVNENPMDFAMQYLESHLHQHLTSAKVADAVFMSRSNFLRHFSRATGQSFNQYLTALRLKKSQQLLSGSSMSVQATCGAVGIQPAQLYRLFKTHLGVSPSEFQRDQKK